MQMVAALDGHHGSKLTIGGSHMSTDERDDDRDSLAEVPPGVDRRTFMMRSAVVSAAVIITGRPVSAAEQKKRAAAPPPKVTLSPELETLDVVLLDIKTWDAGRHKKLTGMDPEPTRAFARRLAARRRTIWLRNVLVPGVTDDLADIAKIAEFAASLGNVERVDVLPFHQMGRFKYERLGIPYALKDTEPPSQELVDRAIAVYRGKGLTAY